MFVAGVPKLTPKIILEGTRLTHKTDLAFARTFAEAILTHETGFSERARKQLEVVQRAVDDDLR